MSQTVEQTARSLLAETSRLAIEHPEKAIEIIRAVVQAAKSLIAGGATKITAAEAEKKLQALRAAVQDNDARADAALKGKQGS